MVYVNNMSLIHITIFYNISSGATRPTILGGALQPPYCYLDSETLTVDLNSIEKLGG